MSPKSKGLDVQALVFCCTYEVMLYTTYKNCTWKPLKSQKQSQSADIFAGHI